MDVLDAYRVIQEETVGSLLALVRRLVDVAEGDFVLLADDSCVGEGLGVLFREELVRRRRWR